MKIAVTGSKGMLGQDVMEAFKYRGYQVQGYDLPELDITDRNSLDELKAFEPKAIINCAAYTNVDLAESEPEKCRLVNVLGVKNLCEICKLDNIPLVQISTDYVFDGLKESYGECDEKNPIGVYGQTKAEAEDAVLEMLDDYRIVRTSWLFGKGGNNFVKTIMKLSSERDEIRVVNDQFGKPTYTVDLADSIVEMLKYPRGIYHITNTGSCSWHEFAQEIVSLTGSHCIVKPCTTEEFPRPAKRPKYSILFNLKVSLLRHWKVALTEYIGDDKE